MSDPTEGENLLKKASLLHRIEQLRQWWRENQYRHLSTDEDGNPIHEDIQPNGYDPVAAFEWGNMV